MEDKIYELKWIRDMLLTRIDMITEEQSIIKKHNRSDFEDQHSYELKSIYSRISIVKSILYYVINQIEIIDSIKDHDPE